MLISVISAGYDFLGLPRSLVILILPSDFKKPIQSLPTPKSRLNYQGNFETFIVLFGCVLKGNFGIQ
jgi:hypothetical protein